MTDYRYKSFHIRLELSLKYVNNIRIVFPQISFIIYSLDSTRYYTSAIFYLIYMYFYINKKWLYDHTEFFFYQKADRKVIQRIGTIFLYHGISATLSTLLRSPLFTCPFLNFTLCINLYLHGYFIDIQLVCIGFTILFPAEYSNRNGTLSVSIR